VVHNVCAIGQVDVPRSTHRNACIDMPSVDHIMLAMELSVVVVVRMSTSSGSLT
jgi:hypothetical protein